MQFLCLQRFRVSQGVSRTVVVTVRMLNGRRGKDFSENDVLEFGIDHRGPPTRVVLGW